MNFLEKIGNKIKSFFGGGSSKKKAATKKTAQKTYSSYQSTSSAKSNEAYRKAQERKRQEEERKKREAELKKKREEAERKRKEEQRKADLEKQRQETIRRAKEYQEKQKRTRENLAAKREARLKEEREKEKAQLKRNAKRLKEQKIGTPEVIARNIKEANAAHPLLSEALRGAGAGAAFLSTDNATKLINKVAAPEIRQAIAENDKNITKKQLKARRAGEVVGGFIPFSMTAKAAGNVGKAIASSRPEVQEGINVLANSGIVKGIAQATGKDATALSAKVADELARDLGMFLTTENAWSILQAAQQDGTFAQKLEKYVKSQAINLAFDVGVDLLPVGIKAMSNKRGAVTIKQGAEDIADDANALLNDAEKNLDIRISDVDADELRRIKDADPQAYPTVLKEVVDKQKAESVPSGELIANDFENVPDYQEIAEANIRAQAEADAKADIATMRQADEAMPGVEPQPAKPKPKQSAQTAPLAKRAEELNTKYKKSLAPDAKTGRNEKHIQKTAVKKFKKLRNEESRQALEKSIDNGEHTVAVHHDAVMKESAEKWIKDSTPEGILTELKTISTKKWKSGKNMEEASWRAEAALQHAQKHYKENPELYEKITKESISVAADNATDAARILRIQSIIAKADPKRRAGMMEELIANSLAKRGKYVKKYGKELGGLTGTQSAAYKKFKQAHPEYAKKIEQLAKGGLTEEEAHKVAVDAAEITYKVVPSTLLEKFTQWRYLAMLSSPKTDVKNVTSNIITGSALNISNGIEKIIKNNAVRAGKVAKADVGFDKAGYSLKVRKNSHLSLDALKKAGDNNGVIAKELFDEEGIKGLGQTPKWETEVTNAVLGKNGKGTGVNKLNDIRGKIMTAEDKLSYEARYRECVGNILNNMEDASNLSKIDKAIINQIATEYAQKATYRQRNEWANALSRLASYATDASASKGQRAVGLTVNAVMPFTKVPMNVLKTVWDFMPHQYIAGKKGLYNTIADYSAQLAHATSATEKKRLKSFFSAEINDMFEKQAKGATGALIFGIGAMLGTSFFDEFGLTTNTGDNEYAKYDKRQGVQDYSIKMKIGDKDYSVTLEWLGPIASVLFTGAEVAKQVEKMLVNNDIDLSVLPSIISEIGSRAVEPVLDMSMLQGLKNAFESASNAKKYNENVSEANALGVQLVANLLQSTVPAVLAQTTRALADADFMLYGDTSWEYQKNLFLSKLPSDHKSVGYKTDSWGEYQNENKGGIDNLARLGENLLLPWNAREIKLDDVDDEFKRIALETDDPDLLPGLSYKTSLVIGQDPNNQTELQLNGKELSAYNHAKTTDGDLLMREALENIMFNRYTTDSKGNKTPIGMSKSEKEKLIKKFQGKPVKEAMRYLINTKEYKNANIQEQRALLKTVNGSSTKGAESKGAARIGERAVWKSQGKDVNEYDYLNEVSEKKQQALAGSGIPAKVIVDFERNAGKTYYYEDDEGGHHQTFYNKKEMMAWLNAHPELDEKTKAALYNAYKNWNAKPYGSASGSGSGRRRKGSSKKKAKVPTPKDVKYKRANTKKITLKATKSSSGGSSSTSLDKLLDQVDAKNAKVKPPKVREVKAI